MSDKKQVFDPFHRGSKGFNALGSISFALGRIADPVLQTAVLCTPLLQPLFQTVGLAHYPAILPSLSSLSPDALSAVPLPRLLLIGLGVANALSQGYWALFISLEPVSISNSAMIFIANSVISTLWSSLYLIRATSAAGPDESLSSTAMFAFGLGLVGLTVELTSEIQRRSFKKDPANKGKLYTGGLNSLVRHPNYTGFLMSRLGPPLLASGWTATLLMGTFFLHDLGGRAANILDKYCGKRYGEQWAQYKRRVPRVMIPGLY